jgi:uncharacterized membrane protein YbjE (DUF340 family)
MYFGLLLILLPLVFGYLVVVKSQLWLHRINSSCSYMVYLILFIMGVSLSQLDNLATNAVTIIMYASLFTGVTITANLGGLLWFDKKFTNDIVVQSGNTIAKLPLMFESMTLLGVVALGFIVGFLVDVEKTLIDNLGEWALMLLLALIGIQLRNSGIALREILLNKAGIVVALIVMVTSWIAGVLISVLIDMPINHALAITSGFGWYSLSGILISDGISPVFGGVAFIADLARELIAILLIPLLIKKYTHCGIGIGGATSMDFTLPIIQKSGGSEVVPMAIISGFILTLVSPVFILIFINL